MKFQKILVPVDEYGKANDALEQALEMVKLSGGSVTALHVTNREGADPSSEVTTVDASKKAEDAGIQAMTEIRKGTPAEVIIAESKNYDVIVMGTARKKKILANSVAREVIKSAACPVIVVRSKR